MNGASRYAPGAPAAMDLGDNTNLWGPPPAALAALAALRPATVSRYPSTWGEPLKEAVAAALGVRPGQVITGCGSDQVLDAAIRTCAAPGSRLVFSTPTFSMIPAFAAINRLEAVAVPFRADWDIDPDRLLAARGAVTYLCAPNNPTGTAASRAAIEEVVARSAGTVIIDEAYAEYAGTSALDLAGISDRVLVTRTMSKAYGLAGLRVGFGIASEALVARIEDARGPYAVTAPSEAAAVAALTDGVAWMEARVAETQALRERFVAAMAGARLVWALPTQANFVLLATRDGAADTIRRLDAALRSRGVAARLLPALAGLGDALRVTIGPWELMTPVLETIAALEEET